jgi:Asx homology domain
MPAADRPKRIGKPLQSKTKLSLNTGSWATSKILTSSSAIIDKDVLAFLITCISGWTEAYSEEEKRAIIDTLPPAYRRYDLDAEGKLRCPIATDFVMEDRFLKRAVSRFNNDLRDGSYEPVWQCKARKAMQERQEGKFDEYLKQHVEDMFGDGNASRDDAGRLDHNAIDGGEADGQAASENNSDGEWVESKTRKINAKGKAAHGSRQSSRSGQEKSAID